MKNYSKKKAQSAMEYLMTYGWAILIVIIVAAALYALGVFNPATFTGRTATGFQTVGAPTDWDLKNLGGNTANITLKLANNKLSNTLFIYNITTTSGSTVAYDETLISLAPGATGQSEFQMFATNPPAAGSTYSIKISMLYNAGGLNHTDTGTITGTVS